MEKESHRELLEVIVSVRDVRDTNNVFSITFIFGRCKFTNMLLLYQEYVELKFLRSGGFAIRLLRDGDFKSPDSIRVDYKSERASEV